ncbi:MAG: hypothetical protein ACYSUN_11330 [Planctomycetota bacterium]|jgi:hypothetical protein
MLDKIFGGKPWFKSMTAWGIVIATVGTVALKTVATSGLVQPETAATLMTVVQWIGAATTALGLRKASN